MIKFGVLRTDAVEISLKNTTLCRSTPRLTLLAYFEPILGALRAAPMTIAATESPPTQSPVIKRWRVTMADKTTRTIEARGFRVEHGALALVLPLGCAAAYAPSTWVTIEEVPNTEG
jgi:hypothetical protein